MVLKESLACTYFIYALKVASKLNKWSDVPEKRLCLAVLRLRLGEVGKITSLLKDFVSTKTKIH